MPSQDTLSSWEKLLEIAQKNTPARRVRRPGQSPSTAPIPSSLHKLPPDTAPPVLLYREPTPGVRSANGFGLPWKKRKFRLRRSLST